MKKLTLFMFILLFSLFINAAEEDDFTVIQYMTIQNKTNNDITISFLPINKIKSQYISSNTQEIIPVNYDYDAKVEYFIAHNLDVKDQKNITFEKDKDYSGNLYCYSW